MNTIPCRCTIGGAGGKSPRSAGTKECIPKPPKTKKHIASVIQKKNDGLNRGVAPGAAAVVDALMTRPPLFSARSLFHGVAGSAMRPALERLIDLLAQSALID